MEFTNSEKTQLVLYQVTIVMHYTVKPVSLINRQNKDLNDKW